jgi:hypothetical protein
MKLTIASAFLLYALPSRYCGHRIFVLQFFLDIFNMKLLYCGDI